MSRPRYHRGRVPKAHKLDLRNWLGQGPQTTDAVTGDPLPYRLAIPQRGRLVNQDYCYGSRDYEGDGDPQFLVDVPATVNLERLLWDTFRGTDLTRISSHTMDWGAGWSEHTGDFILRYDRAWLSVSNAGNDNVATAEAGKADLSCYLRVRSADITNTIGLCARYTSTANFWLIGISSGLFRILEKNANAYTVRSSVAVTVETGREYEIRVTLSGSAISTTLDNGNPVTYGSATFNQTATRSGLRFANVGDSADDFLVRG